MSGRLAGKAAIITGSASGIGEATAKLFAREGAHIGLIDRNIQGLERVAGQIASAGASVDYAQADLANAQQAENAVANLAGRLNRLDVLVNDAAIAPALPFDSATVEQWSLVLHVNLTAYFVCARTAARYIQHGGSIVNIASVHRMISEPGAGAYASAKAAVAQLTRNLAIEFAASEIVVNSISPGFIRTPMSVVDGVDETTTERFRALYLDSGRIPLRRPGQPEEIAAAALFLAARECRYLTGADIVVDGGLTITL